MKMFKVNTICLKYCFLNCIVTKGNTNLHCNTAILSNKKNLKKIFGQKQYFLRIEKA